jgi:RNA polymerase sigma factor (sigma-70 family)
MKQDQSASICEEITFAGFFKSHAKALRNFLYYKFGNEEQADEATQEAFIKLWENCTNVPPEKAKSFLYTVANNTTLNHIAHKKVVLEYSKKNVNHDTNNQSPEFLMEEGQFAVKLQNAIANLSEAQRSAFLLHRIDGKKYHEIAEILEIGVKAVEKRIHGALLQLRKEIDTFK